ncbi:MULTISPECIES: quinone oxidoreductase family protein [Vibrio]|uniref:quinone oxidoreductase family protein n=1 Tax=Vibrio TaxID=662 RepID=UPI0001B958A3|nr:MULTISPECIES: zinc-binding alcohol dehydrogenase family protein [Vibrio]EEX32330.1 quinone oxidoreductase [Vibrio coralliilyticus ATCC BAA-450]MCM5508162.1 zinc-binding alcohol dehydrogenase family protein [Vibrio sp. SCSIO 43169]MDE3897712.1 zinc-binding alcohol dehydrogenase family protein [Vibrio sp. CC007]NRF13117.1 zinc-binding alcohol dehydrogenase family protein [Vibrio coralliilyticus]QFT39372.1 Phthiocerol synthesis polyketide synthase type I PpsC [Vibrio sp. THAF64]
MKAIVIEQTGGSEKLLYKEVAKPELKPGQVLVQVHAAPVNFIDTIIREGNMPPGMMPELPFISGVEGSGIVVDANDTELEQGQKVAFLGPIGLSTYAEYTAVEADKLIALPESADLLQAGSMPVTYFTAYHMLHNVVRAEQGRTALIYASTGGVGTALIQLAKAAGITVIALDRKDSKVEQALSLGADFAFNSTGNWVDKVKEVTNGHGVDYIFNPVAGDSISDDLEVLATLGHIVIFGFLAGVGETNTQAEVVKHFAKAPTISYSEIYATYFSNYPLVKRSMESIYALLDKGLVTPIYSTVPLSEAGTAHEQLQAGKVMGKLLLVP